MAEKIDVEGRLQEAVQSYWNARAANKDKQVESGKIDAGTRGEVTGGTQMGALEVLVADILCEAGLKRLDVRTRTGLELPGYYRATKKWDLIVISEGQLVMAMEFKSQAGASIGNNVNNRSEEAVGSAQDIWTAYREGRFGQKAPPPFLGYLFLLEDRDSVKVPVGNKEPYFKVDPVFRGEPVEAEGLPTRFKGVTYAQRYEWLCRRLVLERVYSAACFMTATNSPATVITQPADDLTFARFAAALRGHATTFVGSQVVSSRGN
ncbi:restriction endonuclease [Acidovorax sp. SUPP3434]|uniref:PaeR7I family type II restriction endonuclease n=1 Tax=Acidovorax sp. SUPP3434 TaxID=2920880 RepID=UPI0023DE38B0|nr:PaeR7I family type II restriction endonuclease [Acidovorax sp. SUPP3434]GKS98831.1 restriction endonuclease [Acidovorax sp. SUPP3434]